MSSMIAMAFRLALAASIIAGISSFQGNERSFQIMNESGGNIEVHWVDLETGKMVRETEPVISPGETFELNSFVGQAFQVKQVPDERTGTCAGGGGPHQCQSEFFTLDSDSDQVIIVTEGIEIHHTTATSIAAISALDLLRSCKDTAMRLLALSISPEDALEAITQCAKFGITREVQRLKEEVSVCWESSGRGASKGSCGTDVVPCVNGSG
eukprot:CCRYP_004847-RA/>CCRYP_004847-RA protein AED:0.01 eAED:0.01 QI:1382/1/1/1/1/1/2/709/210